MTTNTVYLTAKGRDELKKKIDELARERQEAIEWLRNFDGSDTHEERLSRIQKLSDLEMTDKNLRDSQMILAHAKILPRKRDAFKVALGSVVDLIDTQGRLVRYTLVDSLEADPSQGRISIYSPLGRSLVGRQIKDMVEWTASLGTNRLKLVRIG